jgi:hypothetical protein
MEGAASPADHYSLRITKGVSNLMGAVHIIHYQNYHDWTHESSKLGSAMSVADREADENSLCTGEMPCYTPGISAQFLTYFRMVVTAASSYPRIR